MRTGELDVCLRPVDFDTMVDFEYITQCYMDPEIAPLVTVNFNNGEQLLPEDPAKLREHKSKNITSHTFMVEVDGKMVGDVSIDTAFHMLMGESEGTGWISICIGDASLHGKGVARAAMELLEEVAADYGLGRMELGVFAFNKRAIRFYEKMGYNHFATREKFTFYNGLWHDDLRMEKYL